MELVKVSLEGEFFARPDAFQASDEFAAATVSFAVVQPPLSDRGEFGFEPARDDVDGYPAFAVVVDAGDLLGGYGWVPGAREEGGDDSEFGRGVQESLAKGHGFVLVFCAVLMS